MNTTAVHTEQLLLGRCPKICVSSSSTTKYTQPHVQNSHDRIDQTSTSILAKEYRVFRLCSASVVWGKKFVLSFRSIDYTSVKRTKKKNDFASKAATSRRHHSQSFFARIKYEIKVRAIVLSVTVSLAYSVSFTGKY